MNSFKIVVYLAGLVLLAFVCHAAIGADASDGDATALAITVDTNGDDTASIPDFDGDGTIGFGDFVKFVAKFGLGQGDDGYDEQYDLDRNGIIGFSDFVIFAQNFGKGVPSPVVTIPDANLRGAIEDALGKGSGEPITQAEMATLVRLESVNWGRTGIGDLTGLEYANKLSWLSLYGNNITDISPLAGLTNLSGLLLRGNDIVDTSGLAGLTHLTTLNLAGNDIVDISELAGLTNLTTLNLASNDIVDISGLAGLTNLTTLNLGWNHIVDISGLAGLTNLTTLNLGWNHIVDISGLAGLTHLTTLNLTDNDIVDISGLVGLTHLTTLKLAVIDIVDISGLAGLTHLTTLDLFGNDIVDISGLAGLTNLTTLNLESNDIVDISGLAGLTNLTTLNLGFNDIVDISGLAGLTHLTTLNLFNNDIVDISGLAGLTNLTTLNLASNDIVDISGLAGLTNLTTLNLGFNTIVDISGLAGLTNLTTLDLRNNNISDLTPLAAGIGLGSGDTVDVRQNRLDAASIGTLIPALQASGVSIYYDVTVVVSNPQIYNDNVFILPFGGNLDVETFDLPMEHFATRFFEYFSDAFDFLIFVPNLIARGLDPMVPRSAGYWGVKNDVRGIGRPLYFYNRRWGSAGQLQGVIGLAWALDDLDSDQSELIWGPTLHELMHHWGNDIVTPHPHFGFTSNNGALGGFDIDTLVDHGGGTFSAVWGYDAELIVAYSPLELYLAGFVPPADVPDLVVVEDGHWLGHGRFTASRFTTYTIEDIIAEHGPRVPNHVESQKHFRAAVILLVSEEYPATRKILEVLSNDVTLFSHPGEDQFEWYNFYEATGGRGTITMDGLSQFQRRAEAKIVAPRSFGTPPPPIVDHWEIGNGREDLERTPRHIPVEAEQP